MRVERGSISIFLAVTYLTLIVFVMSIVEVTRYQIVRAQAERVVLSATQSVLAGYDSVLKNEYGIFARNPDDSDWSFVVGENNGSNIESGVNQDFQYYLSQNVNQTADSLDYSLSDKLIFKRDQDAYYNMAPLKINTANMFLTEPLVSQQTGGLDYVKEDMMDFMTARLPIMAFAPILESFGAAQKLGKTTAFIDEKNEQIEKAASIEALYLQLYEYLDGAVIDETSGAITMQDTNYLNRLSPTAGSDYRSHLPPDVTLNQANNIYSWLEDYQEGFSRIIQGVDGLGNLYRSYEEASEDLEALEGDIEQLEEDIKSYNKKLKNVNNKIDKLYDADGHLLPGKDATLESYKEKKSNYRTKLSGYKTTLEVKEDDKEAVEDKMDDLTDQMKQKISRINNGQSMVDGALPNIEALTSGDDSYLSVIEKATEVVATIVEEGVDLSMSINLFLAESEANQEDYISASYTQSKMELEAIRDSYSGDSEDFKIKNNLSYIQEILEHDIGILEDCDDDVAIVTDNYSKRLVDLMTDEAVDKDDLKDIIDITGGTDDFYKQHLKDLSWLSEKEANEILPALDRLSDEIVDYKGGPLLDYDGYNSSGESEEEKTKALAVVQGFKDFLASYSVEKILLETKVDTLTLPSGLISEAFGTQVQTSATMPDTNLETDITEIESVDNQAYMGAGSEAEGITVVDDLKAQVLINEYAVQMFRSTADAHRDGVETLAGYSKTARSYPTELEYIYTGIQDSGAAIRNVSIKIFATRVAFNSVHLSTDVAKRTTIMNLATMIAGWWTAGIGAIIIALVIGLLWAMAESLYDLRQLLKGEDVPLLKTSATWITSPEGIASAAVSGAADLVIETANYGLDYASNSVKNKVEALGEQVSDETEAYLTDAIEGVYADAVGMASTAAENAEQVFYEVVDLALRSYMDGTAMVNPDSFADAGTPLHTLLSEVIEEIIQVMDDQVEVTFGKLIELKQEILSKFLTRLESVKNSVIDQVTAKALEPVEAGVSALCDEIDDMNSKGKEVTRRFVEQRVASVTSQTTEVLKNKTGDAAGSQSTVEKNRLIPAVSYEMYIRLFMLMDYDGLDDRVVRMLDLIDYNMAYTRLGEGSQVEGSDLTLQTYGVDYMAEVDFSLSYMWINLAIPGLKNKATDSVYTVPVSARNGYE